MFKSHMNRIGYVRSGAGALNSTDCVFALCPLQQLGATLGKEKAEPFRMSRDFCSFGLISKETYLTHICIT